MFWNRISHRYIIHDKTICKECLWHPKAVLTTAELGHLLRGVQSNGSVCSLVEASLISIKRKHTVIFISMSLPGPDWTISTLCGV